MEFTWPLMLLAVGLVPLLGLGYLALVRRQRRVAERFAEAPLFAHLVTYPPAWQRVLPVAFYLVAVLLLAVAMARPVAALPMPINRAAVMVAIDTSKSMSATDVPPTRLDAAKAAARTLAALVPRSTKIGLVTFSEYGTVLLAPSLDRDALHEALDRLQPQSATAIGGGILEAVRVLPGRQALLRDRLDRLLNRTAERPPSPPDPLEPRPNPEDLVPATLILFSDGVSNFGPDPFEAAQVAREGRVRIVTVGVGTPGGAVMRLDGQMVLVPFDPYGLERIARIADGRYVSVSDETALRHIYRQLGRTIGWERTRMEVSFLLVGLAGVALIAGGAVSLAWFGRLP
jgi:Ca-activated chloride channel family protein